MIAKISLYALCLPLVFVSALAPSFSPADTTVANKFTFGVVPQQSAAKLAEKWTPVLRYLSEKTGYRLDFKTAKDIPTFEKRCATGEYDLAYMNPYHYTVFHKTAGYKALAKEELKSLKGIIVVRKDSPIQKLEELNGATLAFPSPAAFAASVITRAKFSSLGVDISPRYVSSHDSVYRAVAKKLFPAGGGVPRTLKNVTPEIRDQLRILWTSQGYTPHAIAAHPRVAENVMTALLKAMTEMKNDPQGQQLLANINFKGLMPATDEEWNDVRDLQLDILAPLPKPE